MKILKNIKYNGNSYKVGEKVEIDDKDIDLFVEKEIISADYIEIRNNIEMDRNEVTKQVLNEVEKESNTIAYDEATKTDIEQLLTEKGIDYNNRNTKQELYDLLLGSD